MKPTPLQQVADLMDLKCKDQHIIAGVSVDSRLTVAGDLFFAIAGERVDGHDYLANAAANGAVAAVVHSSYAGSSHGLALIRSADVLSSLQLLAQSLVMRSRAKVIAVTGSLGKTTTKDFLTALLATKYKVAASPGNSNSQVGLPLSILNHAALDEDFLILEMGMTHPGQIAKLVQIAPPAIAVITAVSLVHACNFNSIEEIAQAKAELFSHRHTAFRIYPSEHNYGGRLAHAGTGKKVTFSTQESTSDYFLSVDAEQMVLFANNKERLRFPLLNVLGKHNAHNFLAAATAAVYAGMSWEEIQQAQHSLVLPERRMQLIKRHGITFINDAYNAAEDSLKAAISSLPQPQGKGRKIAVIGEMLELGDFSRGCHRAVGEHALKHVDEMVCFGQECEAIYECWQKAGRPVFWTQDRALLIEALKSRLQSGDVVLLKGSRAKKMYAIVDELS